MAAWPGRALGALLMSLAVLPAAAADYATPDEAMAALEAALKGNNVAAALGEVFGPGGETLLRSGDPAADREARRRFLQWYEDRHALAAPTPDQRVLVVGPEDWPLPIPLVEDAGRWRFDVAAGAQEIVDRRIGQNEIEAIRALLAIADAQNDYFARRQAVGSTGYYARRFISAPGRRDGLYWPTADGDAPSPLGLLAQRAAREGTALGLLRAGPVPFHGYRFHMLTGQGPSAPGGARSYLTGGRLTGGYAVLAWPASYRSSGVMTFQVGPDGVVYQKDLRTDTERTAPRIRRFDPDLSWARVDLQADPKMERAD
jgi:hypothetical protein